MADATEAIAVQRVSLPPVLLLHGWGGTFRSTWEQTGWASGLADCGREVIAVDLPGHGASAGPVDPQAYRDLAAGLLDRLGSQPVLDVVGFSLGAKLALELALRDPSRYRKIVLCGLGGNVFAPERAGEAVARVLVQGVGQDTPPALVPYVEEALAAGNRAACLAAVLRRPANPVITPARLMELKHPVLVAYGERDEVALPVEPLLAVLPHATTLVLPGVDHRGLPCERAVLEAAVEFLA